MHICKPRVNGFITETDNFIIHKTVMKTLRILLISFIILSCMDKKEHIIEKTDPSLESQVEKFKGRVLKNGDSVAYDRLRVIYGDWSYRSEEHTSELQSRENLVCRLLLEKK